MVVFDQTVLRLAPEFDAVSIARRVVQHASADVADVAVANRDTMRVAAAETMAARIAAPQAVHHGVMRSAMADAMRLVHEFQRLVRPARIARMTDIQDAFARIMVVVLFRLQLFDVPPFPAAGFAMVEDDVADIAEERPLANEIRLLQADRLELHRSAIGNRLAEEIIETNQRPFRAGRMVEQKTIHILPVLRDMDMLAELNTVRRPWRTRHHDTEDAHVEWLVASDAVFENIMDTAVFQIRAEQLHVRLPLAMFRIGNGISLLPVMRFRFACHGGGLLHID